MIGEKIVEKKKMKQQRLLFNCLLSESRISWITGLHGIKIESYTIKLNKMKSVKSINPFKSVIQTSYDIIKAHGGEIKVETAEGEGAKFKIYLPI